MNLNPKNLLKYLDSRFLLLAYSYGMMGVSVAIFAYFGLFKDGASWGNVLKGVGIATGIMLVAAFPLAYWILKSMGSLDMVKSIAGNKEVTELIARDKIKSFKNLLKRKGGTKNELNKPDERIREAAERLPGECNDSKESVHCGNFRGRI